MNMLAERWEVSVRWDTYLCLEIRKKVEQIIENSRFLLVGWSSNDTYKVVDNHNSVVNQHVRKCSYKRWEVHGLLCKHAIVTIMQIDTNVHCYVDEYLQLIGIIVHMPNQYTLSLTVTSPPMTPVNSEYDLVMQSLGTNNQKSVI